MRSPGGCSSFHQSLTPEAATIVKQAINLARRRGHAQVTPIHVATVMLASPAGLLRSACLKSNSYPHQCKALELCFNPNCYQTLQVANVSNPFELGFSKPLSHAARSEDLSSVIDAWVRRKEKSSVVLVGDCLASCEGVVRAVKERVERGDHNVPMELRYVQFLNCPLLAMKNLTKEEIDMKLGEIRCLLQGCAGRAGVVLYLGDVKWVAEYWAYYNTDSDQQKRHNYYCYCPVEHLIMGLRRLAFGNVENGRIWLMGVSTFNSFMKCKAGNPSLQNLLDLHALIIPSATLDLTLNLDSSKSSASTNTNSSLPSWLQSCKEESTELSTHRQEESVQMKELCRKWDLLCGSKSQKTSNSPDKTVNFASCSPSSSLSISSHDDICKPIISAWPTTVFEPKWASKEHQFLTPNNQTYLFLKPEIISNPNSMPNSASSSETTEPIVAFDRFKENNPENLEALCRALESKVPWHRDIIPEIAMTILRCGSGECKQGGRVKQETWLSFLGPDDDGKRKIARELSRLVFGTQTSSFSSIGPSSFSSSTRADSAENCNLKNNKRARDESSHGYIERLAHAVKDNPHRVFFVEDVDQLDSVSKNGIKSATETGKFALSNGETVPLEDAIVILSCDGFSSASRACSPSAKQKVDVANNDHQEEKEFSHKLDDVDQEASSSLPLDLNIAADDGDNDNHTVGDINILEAVDKQVFFRIQVL
ncbi:hypothetical protein Cgig2_005478 [Carnegiea gigantea]|uniref:SMAX1-like nucleotide binding domain-containing protein n=1 Tax=Carnegiea gigantea TaxID=171969 RepID=A0A9Q1KDD1_9CARY|nr:hypothetical protein Cgig2_005478 [Carnegiea gigantea]